jgi:starch synthase
VPEVAIIPWGVVIDDFLEPHGLTLESFATDFNSGWLIGYVGALATAGISAALVCISRSVTTPTRLEHRQSGAPIVALPLPRPYRAAARTMPNLHGRSADQMFGAGHRISRLPRPLPSVATQLAPYAATPILALIRTLRDLGSRAILCQEYEFPRFDVCAAVSRATGIPLFASFQGGDYQRWRLERALRPVAIRSCAGLVIASAQEIRRVTETYGISSAKVAQIFNPVDVARWRPQAPQPGRARLEIPDGVGVVAWHGRVDLVKKGLDILLEAWAMLGRRRNPDGIRLVLVGDGPDRDEVARRTRALGLSNVVFVNRYLSDVDEMACLLSAADVYVLPSRQEGMAVAALEAMACGLPLVAADVSGVEEMLQPEIEPAGLVVAPEDPERLCAALTELLDDPELRREMGGRGRARVVERFSLAVVGRQLRDFLLGPVPRG